MKKIFNEKLNDCDFKGKNKKIQQKMMKQYLT